MNNSKSGTKKNPKYDLEKYRSLFFTTALALVLYFTHLILNIKIADPKTTSNYSFQTSETFQEFAPTLGITPKKKKQNSNKIKIVKNDTQPADSVKIDNQEEGKPSQSLPSDTQTPLYLAEIMPRYPGGITALKNDIAKKINIPSELKNISGQMHIQFVVTATGNITDIKILKSIHKKLDNEIIKALKKLKKFTPASQNGKKVPIYFILPVNFEL